MLTVYYGVMAFVTLVVFLATVAGMVRRESSNERAGYAVLSAILLCTLLYMTRRSGFVLWLISAPSEAQ